MPQLVRRSLVLLFVLSACAEDAAHAPHAAKPHPAHADASDLDAGSGDAAQDAAAALAPDAAPLADAAVDAGEDSGLVNGRPPRKNVDFDNALRMKTDDSRILQDVVVARQADFYVFTAKAGAFYEMKTDNSDFSPDLVMTLYDADKTQIGENDSGSIWPGDTIDARLVVRLDHDGEYFVRLEDRSTPASFFMQSFPLLYYHFQVRELGPDAPGVSHGSGSAPNDVHFAHDVLSEYDYSTLVGTYPADRLDVFAITGLHETALIGHVLSPTIVVPARTARLTVNDKDKHALASIDLSTQQQDIQPPITDGSYQLTIDGHGEPKDTAYAIDLVMLPENPREQNEADNGQLDKAEALMMLGQSYRRGYVLTNLPASDVDYFKFDVSQDEYIAVICEAESAGSGVRGLRAEVRNDSDKMLASASEGSNAKLQIESLQVMLSGTYYLRLTSKTPEGDGTEPWTRCVVTVSP
jgi:hypothetical protein